jgi:hypothetical protein
LLTARPDEPIVIRLKIIPGRKLDEPIRKTIHERGRGT